MKSIVLASASPRRAELLNKLGIEFEVFVPDIEETSGSSEKPEDTAVSLSYRKAINVCKALTKKAIVIAADTIVVKDSILGKPGSYDEAFAMLRHLQGQWHTVTTGFTVVDMYNNMRHVSGHVNTRVKMRDMPDDLIRAYLETGEPFDKAGAYGIQGYGSLLVERIEGCYYNVVGLPLMRIGTILEAMGVDLLVNAKN